MMGGTELDHLRLERQQILIRLLFVGVLTGSLRDRLVGDCKPSRRWNSAA